MERPAPAYRLAVRFVRGLLRIFFREIEVTGLEHVPTDRGGLFVSWHPNALVDPCLMLARSPRSVAFGARHGLFRWPVLGQLMRALGTVPIYRARDMSSAQTAQRREGNRASLDALAKHVADGAFSALFPEGESHDEPHLTEIKTGAARLYYRARELQSTDAPPPAIVPVGLHYDKKRSFRSRALVWFHPPLALPPELDRTPVPDESPGDARQRARDLTREIERVLHDVIHATEDWELHRLLHRGRKLVRAERSRRAKQDPGRPGVAERTLGFARLRKAYYHRIEIDPDGVAEVRRRVERYDDELRALGLDDHHLDRNPRLVSPWLVAVLLAQALFVFLLLPPFLIAGALVNGPAALVTAGLTAVLAARDKDVASLKLLIGAVVFPLAWVGAGILGYRASQQLHTAFPAIPDQPWLASTITVAIVLLSGIASLRYVRAARETWRATRVRLTRSLAIRSVARLRRERAAICDRFEEMARELNLPGSVADDGTIQGP